MLFGSALATSFTVNSDNSITAVAPVHMQGNVNVIVVLGGVAATSFMSMGSSSLTVVGPPAPTAMTGLTRAVDVMVVASNGTSGTSLAGQFTYTRANQPPMESGVSAPSSAESGIVITGTNFNNITAVSIGGSNVVYTVQSPTSILAYQPSSVTGNVDVTVTTTAGTSAISSADQVTLGSLGSGSSDGSGSSSGSGSGSGSGR